MPKISELIYYPPQKTLKFAPSLVILAIVLVITAISSTSQQFSLLAQAYLHGHLNFLHPIGGMGEDPIFWHGRIYWGDGPFPAILLMPFMALFSAFNLFFYQNYLQWLGVVGVLVLVYKLAQKFGYSKDDSLVLGFGFTLGSVFMGVAVYSSSWFFAQVLATFLLFLAMYLYFSRKNKPWLLIGACCGAVLLTRITAVPILIFFALELWHNEKTKQRLRAYAYLGTPVIIAILLVGLYNFLRFQNPFNGGFSHQLLHPSSAESRSLGQFSLIHIPTNFYSAFLRAPLPVLRDTASWTLKFPFIENNPYGMSLFVTSPYLLSLFSFRGSSYDTRARNLLLATAASALIVFSYYGIGLQQFGYRYSLDFLPGLFVLFMMTYKRHHSRLTGGMKFLLLFSGVFNFYLLASFINV